MPRHTLTRRTLILSGLATTIVTPALAQDREQLPAGPGVRRNISSFEQKDWRDHFDPGAPAYIIADTVSRALHYWNGEGQDYRIYPTSVPMTDELTKRGYTEIVRKKVGPDWTPTASMVERNPDLKYMPPGPDNPLGTHAMYLDWPAYLIHGTHDTRKIGRRSSDGCIGLYNHMIEELYGIAPIGTKVRII